MSATGTVAPATSAPDGTVPGEGPLERTLARFPLLRHAGLLVAVALSAILDTVRLSQNGYANIFYSAGDRSMLTSLHNFFFVSFDPGGLVTVDKPPLALWLQAGSAKLFGFTPLALLLPEAIIGVLAVAALYLIIARRFGAGAAFAGAVTMAVFPSFVAVSRENGVDPLLILLLVLACGAGVRACETGRWRTLIWSAVLVGLAFNTKTLAALLAVPGIAVGYAVCAPGSIPRRALQLLVAGAVMVAVSFSWIAVVEATPASKRPFVGSSTNNTELGLTFEYNGTGRVGGQTGGPHTTVSRAGARVSSKQALKSPPGTVPPPAPTASLPGAPPVPARATVREAAERTRYPIPFGAPPGPLRLIRSGLGDQAAWLLPFALFGLLGIALMLLAERQSAPDVRGERPLRRDPRLASAIVFGGWLLVEALVLSTSKGIVHPYYVSALAPATGAMVGAGAASFVALARGPRRAWAIALVVLALLASVAVQLVLMHRSHYMVWFAPLLLGGAAVAGALFVLRRRLAVAAIAVMLALLWIVPTGYSASTWLAPVEGTFPAAGPRQAAGSANGYGVSDRDLGIYRALAAFTSAHRPGSRWELLTVAADTAAPLTLLGLKTGALGGYSGTDPALDGPGLARYVARGEARWVLLGGEYSLRGGNLATRAVLRACRQLDPSQWRSPVLYPFGLTLFDCAGRARRLAAS